jgi:hypothetical protein
MPKIFLRNLIFIVLYTVSTKFSFGFVENNRKLNSEIGIGILIPRQDSRAVMQSNILHPLGRPRCRWVDNIRMDLGEVGWRDVDWIDLAKDRNRWRALVNSVLNPFGLHEML